MEENESLTDGQKLEKAERMIERKDLEEAQKVLDAVKEKSGRKYYLQGKLFQNKKWTNEARKMFKYAIQSEPENEDYKKALEELETLVEQEKSRLYKNKKQIGFMPNLSDDEKEWCGECCCEMCMLGICEAICNGGS
ncbi:MAG: hypothetical protein K2L12_03375 [Clostridia bacterium]|nr:hypothetical protein [Clostridia bacterium]